MSVEDLIEAIQDECDKVGCIPAYRIVEKITEIVCDYRAPARAEVPIEPKRDRSVEGMDSGAGRDAAGRLGSVGAAGADQAGLPLIEGVCCQNCRKFEHSDCPKKASVLSRWGNWCNLWETR